MTPESGLGLSLGASDSPEDEAPEDMDAEGKEAAADDVMAALKSGDKAAFRDALEAFVHLCYPG